LSLTTISIIRPALLVVQFWVAGGWHSLSRPLEKLHKGIVSLYLPLIRVGRDYLSCLLPPFLMCPALIVVHKKRYLLLPFRLGDIDCCSFAGLDWLT
jgi:hypothetical protein